MNLGILNFLKAIPAMIRNIYCYSTCCGGQNINEYKEEMTFSILHRDIQRKDQGHVVETDEKKDV